MKTTYHIRFAADGSYLGTHLTHDGTRPEDGIKCTRAQHDKAGPHVKLQDGRIVFGKKPAEVIRIPVAIVIRRLASAGCLDSFLASMSLGEAALFYTDAAGIAQDDARLIELLSKLGVESKTILAGG